MLKCDTYTKLDKCRNSVTCKLRIKDGTGRQYTVTAFGAQVLAAIGSDTFDDIEEALISAEKATIVVNSNFLSNVRR